MAIVNRQESSVIEEKVTQIARRYPQALYYPFKVVESNIDVNVLDAEIQATSLFTKLKTYFSKSFGNLNAWIEALDCLVYPEHRFKYWYQILMDMLQNEVQNKVPKAKFVEIAKMMLVDISSQEKALVGNQIGSYNRKFVEKWGKHFVKSFGEDGRKIEEYTTKQLTALLQ